MKREGGRGRGKKREGGGGKEGATHLSDKCEPHTSVTALQDACVCLLAAIYRKF